jgi:nitrate/nitrite-specific signal transduction histidine kinase
MANRTPPREIAYVHQVHGDTQRYLQDLVDENAKLRALVDEVEGENRRLHERVVSSAVELRALIEARRGLADRLVKSEAESRRIAEQFAVVEQQNANLANLYVATYRLHATLERDEVVTAVHEIVQNLIGCQEFAILELALDGRALSLVSWCGVEAATIHAISIDDGIVGEVVRRGETFVSKEVPHWLGPHGALPITACVAMKLDQRVTGVIVLFRMLKQKTRIEAVDRELLELLGTHAASALFVTRVHARELPTRPPPARAR